MAAASSKERIPITVVTGFLGSGERPAGRMWGDLYSRIEQQCCGGRPL